MSKNLPFLLVAVLVIALIAVVLYEPPQPVATAAPQLPTVQQQAPPPSILELRNQQSPYYWRTMYGWDGDISRFARRRTQPPFAAEYSAKVPLDRLPQDRGLIHVTLLYEGRYSDPASVHLANLFNTHPYLSQLRQRGVSHFRTIDTTDQQYAPIAPAVSALPAVVITFPEDQQRPGYGRLIYHSSGRNLPLHGDELSHQIDAAIRRVMPTPAPAYADTLEVKNAVYQQGHNHVAGQCGPDCPYYHPHRPYQPQPTVTPYQPAYPTNVPQYPPQAQPLPQYPPQNQTTERIGDDRLLLLLAVVGGIAVLLFMQRRRTP